MLDGQRSISVLSLFCGCGGLDLGFAQKGYKIIAAYDNWGPAIAIHKKNNSLIGGHSFKVSLDLKEKEIQLSDFPKTDVVLGGPPCQGYSYAGKQEVDDPRNHLYLDFRDIVSYVKPKVFLMENVRGLEKMALPQIKKSFFDIGYNVNVDLVKAIDIGIPQRRERLIIVGTPVQSKKFKTPSKLIGGLFGDKVRKTNILDAIGDLPQPNPSDEIIDAKTFIDDHNFYPFSPTDENFIKHIFNGGYFADAPRNSLPERLKKIFDNPLRYKSPRLFPKPDPNYPSQTVPASSSPSIGGIIAPDLLYKDGFSIPVDKEKYTQDGIYTSPVTSRRFTPRELARLQTFPDDFLFTGSQTTKIKAIGNAVPVEMSRLFAEEIADQIFT